MDAVGSDASAAVIGAAGFLGKALVRSLVHRGVPTAEFTRSSPFLATSGRPAPGLVADTVYWLASSIRPATAERTDGAGADLLALRRLLDAVDTPTRSARCRIVLVSSGGTVYDPVGPTPHAENSPIAPANDYGRAMLAAEHLVAGAADAVVLRVANAYGPGQPARRGQGVIAHWMQSVGQGEPVTVLGDGGVQRDYVFLDDVIDALVRVHTAARPPRVVNIGSGRPTSLAELVRLLGVAVAPLPITVRQQPARSFDAPSTWLDVTLAADALDWRPAVDLPTGLRATWQAQRLLAAQRH